MERRVALGIPSARARIVVSSFSMGFFWIRGRWG